jgi:hypothetical protein
MDLTFKDEFGKPVVFPSSMTGGTTGTSAPTIAPIIVGAAGPVGHPGIEGTSGYYPRTIDQDVLQITFNLRTLLTLVGAELSQILGRPIAYNILENTIHEATVPKTVVHLVVFDAEEDKLKQVLRVTREGTNFITYGDFINDILRMIMIGGLKQMTCDTLGIDLKNEVAL